jgi:hypothetical protein
MKKETECLGLSQQKSQWLKDNYVKLDPALYLLYLQEHIQLLKLLQQKRLRGKHQESQHLGQKGI